MSKSKNPCLLDDPAIVSFPYLVPYVELYKNRLPPLLRFEISANGKTRGLIGSADTGSQRIIIDYAVGKSLGIDVEGGTPRPVAGIDRELSGWEHAVLLSVPDIDFAVVTPVTFAMGYRQGHALLGRTGFLNKWIVAFRDHHGVMYFTREDIV